MKLGIKVGPQKESIRDLEKTRAPFAEVWFRIDALDDYAELFTYLTEKGIDTGLHFWGLTHDGLLPSIVHTDPTFTKESLELIKQTIDIANQNHFSYVNIHPGFATRVLCDLKTFAFSKTDPIVIPLQEATDQFIRNAEILTAYADSKHVLLTIETTPIRIPQIIKHGNNENRKILMDFPEYSFSDLPIETIHFAIANDFGHTAANCITDDPSTVSAYVFEKTELFAPKTRLLHLGYIIPPYNGTDFHDHLDNPMFQTADAIPNKNHMIELLKLFQNRPDVWALVEPNGNHVRNYFLAQKLLNKSSEK
jgi:hypothetical protein